MLNDIPANAFDIPLTVSNAPCVGLSGDINEATVVAPEGTFQATNPDLWYSFTTASQGVRIEVATGDFDALIEVLDDSFNTVDVEDVQFAAGNEVLSIGNLTAGALYYVRVGTVNPTAAAAPFDICIQVLRDTRCDYGPGPYSLCGLFKADFVFADQYIFNFTSQTDGMTYSSEPQSSTFLNFAAVEGLQYNDTYDVAIQSVYNLMNGGGEMEMIVVENNEPCTVEISEAPTTQMSPEDNSTNAGPQFLGNYIEAEDFICGVTSWEWEFTRTDVPEIPVTYNTGSSSRALRISDVLTESALGGTFDVRVRPVIGSVEGDLGATQELAIIGIAGTPVVEAVVIESDDERVAQEEVVAKASIYPNPSTGALVTVNVTDLVTDVELAQIDIMDFTGRVVATDVVNINNGTINQRMSLNQLATGTYVIRITVGDLMMNETLIIPK